MSSAPSPILLLETINGHQRTAALRAGIELDLFTAIGEGHATVLELARRSGAAERGVRILSDYLVILGFLTKQEGRYALTPDSAAFLDRRSPAYLGGAIEFLLAPMVTEAVAGLTETVRAGTTRLGAGAGDAENPMWVRFARAMAPMMAPLARQLPDLVPRDPQQPLRVLDIAAGHGLFGLAFAERFPRAEITGQDWPGVLAVARENARAAGVEDRYRLLPGSAFEVEYGEGYDLILLTNFLHHFDIPTCEALLRKVRAALAEDGLVATLEFVPNDDRVTPPGAAAFALTMLASTPAGDAYTFAELEAMFRNAGFSRSELHPLPPSAASAVVSHR